MSANRPILMTCHRSPSTKCCLPSFRSSAPMFTTWQPMAEAEFSARFRFSCTFTHEHSINISITAASETDGAADGGRTWMVKGVSFFLLMVLSSIVSGTDRLIILLRTENKLICLTSEIQPYWMWRCFCCSTRARCRLRPRWTDRRSWDPWEEHAGSPDPSPALYWPSSQTPPSPPLHSAHRTQLVRKTCFWNVSVTSSFLLVII